MSHSLLEESISPFPAPAPSFLPLSGVIRNGSPQYKDKEDENIWEQNQLHRLQMVQFECPGVRNPSYSSTSRFNTRDVPFLVVRSARSAQNPNHWRLERQNTVSSFGFLKICIYNCDLKNEFLKCVKSRNRFFSQR